MNDITQGDCSSIFLEVECFSPIQSLMFISDSISSPIIISEHATAGFSSSLVSRASKEAADFQYAQNFKHLLSTVSIAFLIRGQ